MSARLLAPLRRVADMDRAELLFRVKSTARARWDRARLVFAPPAWHRGALGRALAPPGPATGPDYTDACRALAAADWGSAHRALARHVLRRASAFPVQAAGAAALAAAIRGRFPGAPAESVAPVDRILSGRYDVLGYAGLDFGSPPRWHEDPVHRRQAPGGFWASVPFLDPASGDHKVIWEVNRHQHWLALARAHHLANDTRAYPEFVRQLEDWLAANPPLLGINWASMLELAFRGLSWIWCLQLFSAVAADDPEPSTPWVVDLLLGLDRQLTHIEQNLSLYFSPNTHLTGEALALYVAGAALPELRASGRRMARGRAILIDEATAQVHADGGHAELSAHYHRYTLDFYLMALQVARAAGDAEGDQAFAATVRRQARYLRALADDTGRLPLIGDDDGGHLFPICGRPPADCRDTLAVAAALLDEPGLAIGRPPEEAYWRCAAMSALDALGEAPARWPSAVFPETGYCVSRTAEGDHLVFDAGPHGFLNGGHAHADALSIVATVGGVPLLVDPGTGSYTADPSVRDRFRSTAMHNTVVVDGRSQSVPCGPFHWVATTDAVRSFAHLGERAEYFEARHEAYAPVVHVRAVFAVHDLAWLVVDHLLETSGPAGPIAAEAFWHLHPEWSLVSGGGRQVLLQHGSGRTQALAASGPFATVRGTKLDALGAYAPAYGRIVPAECLRVAIAGPAPQSCLTVVPMAGAHATALAVEPLALTEPPGSGWHAAGWRLRVGSADVVLLSSVERDGAPATPLAAPAARWGIADLRIVARAGVLVSSAPSLDALLVNGRHLAAGAVQVNHDLSLPLIRSAIPPPPAVMATREPIGADRRA